MQTKELTQSDPIAIDKLLQGTRLGPLLNKAQLIQQLNTALFNIVSANLKPHCQVVNYDFNVITIGTKQSHIANQLFYQQNHILQALQRSLPKLNIELIKVRISPHF